MPCLHDLKYVLKATSKQTSTRQIFPHKIILRYYFFKSAHVYLLMEWLLIIFAIYRMESRWLKQDGGQWFVIRQSCLLTDCVKL